MAFGKRMAALFQRRSVPDWNQNADFFRFTRGRFVSREQEQMAEREIHFDMNELCKLAGKAVGRVCVNVEKCADGMYNKAFILTMDDDQQVVAKVPNPNAGLPHFTTASEVATMDMMRNVMRTPTPRVLAWDSSSQNIVKAEYIIMEKAKGVQLGTVWPTMTFEQKTKLMKAVAMYQRTWSRISFSRIGSIYYAKDLPHSLHIHPVYFDEASKPVMDTQFAIGPIQGREWVDFGRGQIKCDRGPWTSTEGFWRAMIERDQNAIRNLAELPKPLSMLCGPSLYQPTAEKKLRACEDALKILPQVLPQEPWASGFHLWHDDLHGENLYVDPDDPTNVTAMIDWQSNYIAPLLDHTIHPGFLDIDGPALPGLEIPNTPDLPEDVDPIEEATAFKLYDQQLLMSGYRYLLKNHMKPCFEAAILFERGEAYCRACIAMLNSPHLRFSEAELAQIQEDAEKTEASINAMKVIENALGSLFPEKGIVRLHEYEASKAALRKVKEQVLEDFSTSEEERRVWEEAWPFDE